MARPFELLLRLPAERFASVLSAAPKKVREELFRRAGIKNKGGAFSLKTSQKTNARINRLYSALASGVLPPDELGEEVIRQYLYHRRDLLAEALDFLGVEHDHGLTDRELDFFADLEAERATQLRAHLLTKNDEADVDLYLGFMDVKV